MAQDEVTVQVKGKKQAWSVEELQKLYLSACSVVQHEYGQSRAPRPRFTLILGADKDQLDLVEREIRLKKWDGFLFAQGAVLLAFQDLMSMDQRITIAKRAVGWADATVNVSSLRTDAHSY